MKTVFFDFDGTLTMNDNNIWKEIWKHCGYSITPDSYYADLYKMFLKKEISHQKWCDLTCQAFIEKNFDVNKLLEITKDIILLDGLEKFLITLKQNDYSLHILSGNVETVIKLALGNCVKYFDTINGNQFYFDNKNKLCYIKGTSYDFEGKAKCINEYVQQTNCNVQDVYFVGNGYNDEWAYLSGCKTICINPTAKTDYLNKQKWSAYYKDVKNINQILPAFGIDLDLSK